MNPIDSLSAPVLPPQVAAPSSTALRGAKAAREFEAQLISNVLESLEQTFAAIPGEDSPAGTDDYNYLGTQALAGALADRGGFGIGALISRYLAGDEGK